MGMATVGWHTESANATVPTTLAALRTSLRGSRRARISRRVAPPRPFRARCSAIHASGRSWIFDPGTPPFARSRRAGRGIAVTSMEALLAREGCEQGGPLAPVLYALGQHDTLVHSSASFHHEDALSAFLDDLCSQHESEPANQSLYSATETLPNCNWTSGEPTELPQSAASSPREFVAAWGNYVSCWTSSPLLPDLQCAWLVLAMCASPRAKQVLRTVAPQPATVYAHSHDQVVWEGMHRWRPASPRERAHALLGSLACSIGGVRADSRRH